MTRKVLVIIVALALVVGVFAFLNVGDREDRLATQREAEIILKVGGEEFDRVKFDNMMLLTQHTFEEVLQSSDSPDQTDVYKGVLMKDVLDEYRIPYEDKEQIMAQSADGFSTVFTIEEVLEDDNVYIVYEINGEPLAPKDEGGSGPYQLVVRQDEFAMRWIKFLMELDVN